MAKKLASNYRFIPTENTVVVSGNYTLEKFLLITNVVDNEIMFTFNDPSVGVISHSVNTLLNETTLVLAFDCSNMSAADRLQIFVEVPYVEFEPSETFLDPVSKIRVSTPQNLIDTDFEYGLQPSRWETIELVNNIPSFYASQSDYVIPKIISVETIEGSENIVVTTLESHGVSVGAPIDVQGLGNRTAEGKFLVTKVPTPTSFVYESKGVQSNTANIIGVYTTITPGQFYTGSDIKYSAQFGVSTNEQDPTTLNITTDYAHGLLASSSLYLTNTIGSIEYNITAPTNSTAPDGRPYVDYFDTRSTTVTLDSSKTETKQITGTYAFKFGADAVSVTDNTFTWPTHRLQPGDVLLFVPSAGDTAPGGLQRFQVYYVKTVPTVNTFTLCETTNGAFLTNPVIDIISTGTSNFGRHQFILGYEIAYISKLARNYDVNFHTRRAYLGSGSGQDLFAQGFSVSNGVGGYYGLGAIYPPRVIVATRGSSFSTNYFTSSAIPYFSTAVNSLFNFNKTISGTEPDGWDFIEDFQRFTGSPNGINVNNNWTLGTQGIIRAGGLGTFSSLAFAETRTAGDTFVFLLQVDPEADSFYFENHGFLDEGALTITTLSGQNIIRRTDTSTALTTSPIYVTLNSPSQSTIRVISNDRFRIADAPRIKSASGTYSFSSVAVNPTANSLYIQGFDLVNGEEVLFSEADDDDSSEPGVFPVVTTGAVTPSITGTLTSVYNSVKETLDDIREDIMESDAGLLLYNGTQSYYPFSGADSAFNSGRQFFSAYRNGLYVSNSVFGIYTVSLTDSEWATGQEWDPFAGSALGGKGYRMISTPFATNSTTPYHIDVYQIPNHPLSQPGETHRFLVQGASNNSAGTIAFTDINNAAANWTSLGQGWRFTYDAIYFAPTSAFHGFISLMVIIDNSNWSGYFNNYSGNNTVLSSTANRAVLLNGDGTGGQRYLAQVILPIKANSLAAGYGLSTGTKLTAEALAQTLATNMTVYMTRRTLGPGINNVFVDVVNGNRVRLKNELGAIYDFNSFGTAPLRVESLEQIGGADGYYPVTSATERVMSLLTDAKIPKRNLSFTNTDVATINAIKYLNIEAHKLSTGQEFVYETITGDIAELVDGTTYFAISVGPDHLSVAANYEDAITNTPIILNTVTGGTFIGIEGTTINSTGSGATFDITVVDTGYTVVINQSGTDYTGTSVINILGSQLGGTDSANDLTITVLTVLGGGVASFSSSGTAQPGSFNLVVPAISGLSPGVGTVALAQTSSKIIGTDTLFRRYYKLGDVFRIKDTTTNPPTFRSYNIATVISDTEITLTGQANITLSSTNYYVETKVNVRPDGVFLHRPFDGGVEMNAGTSPNSSIVRQTRKYFRYQSGKGIQVSLAINFNPSRLALDIFSTGNLATITTEYPHGLVSGNVVTVEGSNDPTYNGTFVVTDSTDLTFKYEMAATPTTSIPGGLVQYNIASWADSFVRAGLFDYQNGMFFEYNGNTLYAVRRSSVQQLPGTVNSSYGSNVVFGNSTKFGSQLAVNEFVVIRGYSYRITKIVSDTEINIQPYYKGVTATDIILTKTVDTKVPQEQWNIDISDGTGPSGYDLNLTKIQMAYIDYSWYGAGKIRFGFKDTYGKVIYVHQFIHNNILEEAYMRSGNIPCRYEIYNGTFPTYVPSLFHWGTSVIMDGQFDDDKAYLFTANSNTLSFTNNDSKTAVTNANSQLVSVSNTADRTSDWYVRLQFAATSAALFTSNTPLYTADGQLNGQTVAFIQYSGSDILVYIYQSTSSTAPATFPIVASGATVNVGAPASGGELVDLTKYIPLISIRLAPSVDNNLTGPLGAREVINRMQLQLRTVGITLTHDCEVSLILNGSLDNAGYESVDTPSLSDLIKHRVGDKVINGSRIFSFRASGGTATATSRSAATAEFDLSKITDLGNSILGGDGVFPNGPDLLTVAITPVDTSSINATTPLSVAGRITWTESQA